MAKGSSGRKKAGTAHNADVGYGIGKQMRKRMMFGDLGKLTKPEEAYFMQQTSSEDINAPLRARQVILTARRANKRRGVKF